MYVQPPSSGRRFSIERVRGCIRVKPVTHQFDTQCTFVGSCVLNQFDTQITLSGRRFSIERAGAAVADITQPLPLFPCQILALASKEKSLEPGKLFSESL